VGLHHCQDFGLAFESVCLQVGNGPQRLAVVTPDGVAVRWQDEAHLVLRTGSSQPVQRVEVGAHVAVRRIDHGGAAVEDVVAAEQQPVFEQQQAQVIGRVAGRVEHHQGMGQITL